MTNNDWCEIPPDPETQALSSLARPAVSILRGPSSPLEWPRWVEDWLRNPRRLELSGREGAETLDTWRADGGESPTATVPGNRTRKARAPGVAELVGLPLSAAPHIHPAPRHIVLG